MKLVGYDDRNTTGNFCLLLFYNFVLLDNNSSCINKVHLRWNIDFIGIRSMRWRLNKRLWYLTLMFNLVTILSLSSWKKNTYSCRNKFLCLSHTKSDLISLNLLLVRPCCRWMHGKWRNFNRNPALYLPFYLQVEGE